MIGVLVIFAPMPKAEKAAGEKAPGLLENIRNSHFSAESIALIVIGFTCTATFQLWLNCAQTFAKDLAGVSDPSMMQTYYSFGSLAAIIVTAGLVSRIKGVRFLFVYPLITLITLVLVYMTRSETMCYIGCDYRNRCIACTVCQPAFSEAGREIMEIYHTACGCGMI